jgi:hypothetical protein
MKKLPLIQDGGTSILRWFRLSLPVIDKDARAHMKRVLESYPRYNLEERRKTIFFKNPANTEREIEALRKAGAPEHPPSQ